MKYVTQKWILGGVSSLLFLGVTQAQLASGKAPEIVAGGQWFNGGGVKLADSQMRFLASRRLCKNYSQKSKASMLDKDTPLECSKGGFVLRLEG